MGVGEPALCAKTATGGQSTRTEMDTIQIVIFVYLVCFVGFLRAAVATSVRSQEITQSGDRDQLASGLYSLIDDASLAVFGPRSLW